MIGISTSPQTGAAAAWRSLLCVVVLALGLSATPLPALSAPQDFIQPQSQSLARPIVSPAQQVFDQVNTALQTQYGGLSTTDRSALHDQYQRRLSAVCQSYAVTPCPSSTAYPVVSAEVSALHDEHSFVQRPDEYRDFVTAVTGGSRKQFGLRLGNWQGENRLVLEVLSGSASAEAGLQRGDVLNKLDGKPYRYTALIAARTTGRSIQLEVQRAGHTLNVTLAVRLSSTRELPSWHWLSEGGGKEGGTQKATGQHVALLRIPTFLGSGVGQAVHDQVRQIQAQADAQHAALLIDLRGNAGGDLAECDTATSAFVPGFVRLSRSVEGVSRVQVKAGARLEDDLMLSSVANPALWQGPLAVLVDGGSASCSEFLAYEVQYASQEQQLSKAVVVGEATAGVGNTATRIFPLLGGGALQLSILNYLKPDGQPYPQRVTPDIKAVTDPLQLSQGRDSMVEAAKLSISN